MTKRLILNGFVMNSVSHIHHGLWRRDDTLQTEFNDLNTWTTLAKALEAAKFDALFSADIIGVDPAYKGGWETYIEEAVQIPINDSGALIAALVGATDQLGLTLTSSILQEHPFNFARKISTLDHLSKGRIGWNLVTSVSHNAAQNFGLDRIVKHDERYAWADEYIDVVYKLWEGSWDEGAVLADKKGNRYADPDKIHRIHHEGKRYKVLGPHLSQPSPQRVPLLFQAGSSTAGRAFAARNAEGTYIVAQKPEGARRQIEETNRYLVEAGRKIGDLKYIQGMSFIIGSTEEEAARKARDIAEDVSLDGYLAHLSRDLGIDLGVLDPERPVKELEIEGVQGVVRAFEDSNPGVIPKVRDLGQVYAKAGNIIGTPESIADALEVWQEAGIDGVNVSYHRLPASFLEFAEHVVPELQKRGLAQRDYAPGTYREKILGEGARVNTRHPASRYRGAFATSAAPVAKAAPVPAE